MVRHADVTTPAAFAQETTPCRTCATPILWAYATGETRIPIEPCADGNLTVARSGRIDGPHPTKRILELLGHEPDRIFYRKHSCQGHRLAAIPFSRAQRKARYKSRP